MSNEIHRRVTSSLEVVGETKIVASDETGRFSSEAFSSVHSSSIEIPKETVNDLSIEDTLPKDGFWSWVACVVAFIDQLFLFGTLNIYSLFLVQFQKELGCTTAQAAWLGSMTMGLMKLFGPIASSLTMHFGNRLVMIVGCILSCSSILGSSFVPSFGMLFATMCVPFALGVALVITPACVVPVEYFKKHQAMTMGIVAAGSSTGTLILAPTVQIIMGNYGWRFTFRCLSICYFLLIFLNVLIKPKKRNPVSYIQKPMLKSMIEDLDLWKNRVFVLWVLAIAIVYFGYQIPVILLASYTVYLGSTPLEASYIFVVMGGATTLSRLLTGSLLRCDLLSRLHVKQIIFVMMGTTYLLLTHVISVKGLYVFAVVRGLLDGAHIVMLPMLTASMVGSKKAILGWGHLAGAISITYTLGPATAGAVRDYTDSFTYPFIIAGLPLIAAGLLLFLLPWAQRTGKKVNMLRKLSQIREISKGHLAESFLFKEKRSPDVPFDGDGSDPVGSIHDFIRFAASLSEMNEKAQHTDRKHSGLAVKDSKKHKMLNALFYPEEKTTDQSPMSLSHSDTFVLKFQKQEHQM